MTDTSKAIQTERDALGGSEIVGLDAGAGALSQAMVAQVQARYVMALRRPRNLDQVRQELLRECARPSFAKAAWFYKPVGIEGIEGFTVRFTEAALRIMRNIFVETTLISETALMRSFNVQVTDLESNTTHTAPVTVSKTVERRRLDDGVVPLGKRKNSRGEWTYLVPATDDDLLNKQNSLISKAIRSCGLRIVPGDLLDEAKDLIKETRVNKTAEDPDAERKGIVDAFDGLRVPAADLSDYLGHDLGTASPAELVHLRAVFAAVRDGEVAWQDALRASPYRPDQPAADAAKDPKLAGVAKTIGAKVAAIQRKKAPAQAPAAAAQAPAAQPAEASPPPTAAEGPKRQREPGEDG